MPSKTDYLYPVASIVGAILVWQVLCVAFGVPKYILPTPVQVAQEIGAQHRALVRHALVTLEEIALGFGLAVVVGVPLAVALDSSRRVALSIYPIMVSAQSVPKVAIAPLFVLWWGFGILPKVVVTFLICFFPITIDTVTGLRSVSPELLLLARSTGARAGRTFLTIKIPHALPNIFAGLKVAITLAVVGTIVGEFVGADRGLGYLLMEGSGNLNTPLVFADLTVLVALGVGLYLVVEGAEALLIPWHVSRRREPEESLAEA